MSSFRITSRDTGFTLIELLLVISIISLLSSVMYVSLGAAKVRAQDTKKVVEVQQTQKALDLYKEDRGSYPGVAGVVYQEDEGSFRTLIKNELVDKGYLGGVPDSPDDSYSYVWNGDQAVVGTSLSTFKPNSCQTTIAVSEYRPTPFNFLTFIEVLETNSQDNPSYPVIIRSHQVEDFNSSTKEWSVDFSWILRCNNTISSCDVLEGPGSFDAYSYQDPSESTQTGKKLQKTIEFAYESATTFNDVCNGVESYCACTDGQ